MKMKMKTMSDLIRRQDAIHAIEDMPNAYNGWSDTYDKAYIIGVLEEVPSAELKTGRWKLVDHLWQCDQCQYRQNEMAPTNFCPSCGARMRW